MPEQIKRRTYVGEDLPLSEIMKLGPTPVQFENLEIASFPSYFGPVHRQKLPNRLLVLCNYERGVYGSIPFVTAFDPKTRQKTRIYLAADLQIHALTGRQGREMRAAFDDEVKNNFGLMWSRPVLTLGADPEIFVESHGQILPAFDFLPDKGRGLREVGEAGRKTEAYWDGFQAEFSLDAQTCIGWLSDVLQLGLKSVFTAARLRHPDAKLSLSSVVQIPDDVLASAQPQHVEFGCAPSHNAYGLTGAGGSLDGRSTPFRFAGGHIHIGTDTATHTDMVRVVKALDAVLGVACVSLFEGIDNPLRRQYYGLAGEYRLPAHGVEYRVLSNAWLCHPFAANLVFELARLAYGVGHSRLLSAWDTSEEETISVIQRNDVAGARSVMQRNETRYLALFNKLPAYAVYQDAPRIFRIWMEGISSVVRDPSDIEGNWNLSSIWNTHGDGVGKNWTKGRELIVRGEKV